jgi:hypothetical protein
VTKEIIRKGLRAVRAAHSSGNAHSYSPATMANAVETIVTSTLSKVIRFVLHHMLKKNIAITDGRLSC